MLCGFPQGAKVGFTTMNQVWASYSPVKNSPADALAKATAADEERLGAQ